MTDTKTSEHEQAQKQPSDARVILGPLVKHAAIGLVLVGIIITTAVMLDRQFNTIDQEVAALQAQLEQAQSGTDTAATDSTDTATADNTPDTDPQTASQPQPAAAAVDPVTPKPVANNTPLAERSPAEPAAAVVSGSDEPQPIATEASVPADEPVVEMATQTADVALEHAVDAPVRPRAESDFFDRSMQEYIAARNAYLQEQDRAYLEEYRASQQRQLRLMRERLARHQQRILEREQRYQELYDIRAADLDEMQERRKHFLPDRI